MKQAKLRKQGSRMRLCLSFASIFAIVGVSYLLITKAATPTANLQPEDGSIIAPATKIADSTASGGSYVQFNAASTSNQPFTATSPWNTTVPANATWRDEPLLRSDHWWVNREQYSMPYATTTTSDPMVTVTVPSTWGWPAGPVFVRAPVGFTGDSGTDASVVIQSGTTVCDFWQFSRKSDTTATAAAYACNDIVTGTGFGSPSPWKGAGIRASGASTLGGLLQGKDFSTGAKKQALAVSLLPTILKRGYVSPAISEDSGNSYSGTIPMGSRLGIPSGTAKPSGLSSSGSMVWDALIKYGAYALDQHYGSSPVILYADPRSTADAQIAPMRIWWNGSADDLDLIMPYVRVCTANCI